MTVLVTGAGGFVGRALVRRLQRDGDRVRVVSSRCARVPAGVERCWPPDWTTHDPPVAACEAVIHLAARVHVVAERAADPLTEFRTVNVDGTIRLAEAAAAAGVKRFVFVSSIKVNGETGVCREDDDPRPEDAYGLSKLEAERALRSIEARTGLPVVIVRPPLVYGPGVAAHFELLVNAVRRGVPFPLGAIRNQRSFLALDNLTDFLVACARHPAAAGETFLVSDGEDLSTPDLIRRVAAAMGRRATLVRVPERMLAAAAALTRREAMLRRLRDSLTVGSDKAWRVLAWRPPIGVDEGLRRAVGR